MECTQCNTSFFSDITSETNSINSNGVIGIHQWKAPLHSLSWLKSRDRANIWTTHEKCSNEIRFQNKRGRSFSLERSLCSDVLCVCANPQTFAAQLPRFLFHRTQKKRIHSSDRGDVDVVPGEAVNLERGSFYGLNQRVTANSKHHQRRNKRQTRTEIEASFLSGSIAAVDVATYKYGPSHHCVPYVHHVSYSSVIDSKKTCVLFFFFERERESLQDVVDRFCFFFYNC